MADRERGSERMGDGRQDVRSDEERARSAGPEQEYGAGYAGGYGRSGGYGTEGGDGDGDRGADAGEPGGMEVPPDPGLEQEL